MSPSVENSRRSETPPLAGVFLISAAALAYEVLLMRLFSIIQWHHFAYMVISLALLGYGASGAFLTLFRGRLRGLFQIAFLTNCVLFAFSAVGCFALAQKIPFNALELLWDSDEWFLLSIAYLLLFIPFFFAANCICLAFDSFGEHIARIYSYDLLGGGLGALSIVCALLFVHPTVALQGIAVTGLIAAVAAGVENRYPKARWCALLLAFPALPLLSNSWMELRLSPYKDLSQMLQIVDAKVVAERSSPLGEIAIVQSPTVPLRHAPGLSLRSNSEPPPQLGVFSDGDLAGAITRYDGHKASVSYLDYLTSALPYHVTAPQSVLIVGLGGGAGVLQANYHNPVNIDVTEINPQLIQLVTTDFGELSGWHRLPGNIRIEADEARSSLAARDTRYNLIQLDLLDGAGASAGLHALNESYLYTVEGMREFLQHLQPGGLLAVTRWLRIPPRDGLKLFATANEVLRRSGIDQPGERIAMIRGWKTTTLLVKNGRFSKEETQRIDQFCRERAFDPVYYPGMSAIAANYYNRLAEPYFHYGARALLGADSQVFSAEYPFDILPATDNRPYFHNFFKWSLLPEILASRDRGGISLLELGYLLLVITLLQASLASLLLIIVPLFFVRTKEKTRPCNGYTLRIGLYFLAIGLAFLFIEIAVMQRFLLFLGHPLYSIAVVLSGFLVFSGFGSLYSRRYRKLDNGASVRLIIAAPALLAFVYLWLLDPLLTVLMTQPDPLKIVFSLALIAPLAFSMGMPFPLGLTRISARAPQLVPWAWGINGCASLLSAILATLLALHYGFNVVIALALALYLTAALLRP